MIDATALEISQKLYKKYRHFTNVPSECNIERLSVFIVGSRNFHCFRVEKETNRERRGGCFH